MNCSEAKFYENYLTSDFHTKYKHCYFKTCLCTRQNGVGNRDKVYNKHGIDVHMTITGHFGKL